MNGHDPIDGPALPTYPVLSFRGVGRTYPGPPPLEALHPTDLDVWPGEHIAIVGPSGSGKSTFLNLVGLLDRPTSGTYQLDGIDVGDLPESDRAALRARRIGFVFQAFHLLPHRSAVENVMLAMTYTATPRRERHARAVAALDLVGLARRQLAVPSELSGGERQRVAIARALVNRPSLLLCDEPTGNLDTGTAQIILQLLDDLHADGLTLLVITHDPVVAKRSERMIAIRDGSLSAVPAEAS